MVSSEFAGSAAKGTLRRQPHVVYYVQVVNGRYKLTVSRQYRPDGTRSGGWSWSVTDIQQRDSADPRFHRVLAEGGCRAPSTGKLRAREALAEILHAMGEANEQRRAEVDGGRS